MAMSVGEADMHIVQPDVGTKIEALEDMEKL